MLATYGAAALIIVASALVGRAFLGLLGRRDTAWLESSVGLAIIVVTASICTRIHFGAENSGAIPERSELALIALVALVAGSIIYCAYERFEFINRESVIAAAPVVALTVLMASLPFIASGHLGIPGIGVNNDLAAHLIWADWLQEQLGPAPTGIAIGYPVGPHGLAATLAEGLRTEPLYSFLGLLVAIPVITGLTALNLFGRLPAGRRTIAAALVALPYLAASTLGIAGFKELLAGLWLLTFVLVLRTITRETGGRVALIASLAAMSAAIVASYSYPGLAWLGAAAVAWAIGELVLAKREERMDEVRWAVRRAAPLLGLMAAALMVVLITELPRIKNFIDAGVTDTVAGTDSKLRYSLPPPEAFGIWPSGEFLLGAGEFGLSAWPLFALVGLVGFGYAALWWVRRRDLAIPMGVTGSAVIYLGTLVAAGRYVEAKALAVPAALIMAFILGALLLPERERSRAPGPELPPGASEQERRRAEREARRRAEARGAPFGLRTAFAIVFIALAGYSSFLALRDTVVAPTTASTS